MGNGKVQGIYFIGDHHNPWTNDKEWVGGQERLLMGNKLYYVVSGKTSGNFVDLIRNGMAAGAETNLGL